MDDIYKNIEEYNPTKKRKILIVFDNMTGDKKLYSIVTEFFIRYRKLNISLVFISNLILLFQKIILCTILL